MQWGSSLSRHIDLNVALDECATAISAQLDSAAADFVAVFTSRHDTQANSLSAAVSAHFPNAVVIGCSGSGVIGSGREEEEAPALSVTAGVMPGVALSAFHVTRDQLPSPDAPPDAWHTLLGVPPDVHPDFIVLAEPFTMDSDALLAGLDYAYPRAVKVGGLASGGGRFSPHSLVLNGAMHREGAVGVALSGNIVIDSIVAQGCRPIGEAMHITDAEQNMIEALDGMPPMECLQNIYEAASPRDQGLMRHNLFMGIAMDPLALSNAAGGFLIRNVLGVNQGTGAIAVGALVREGQLVQFHVRDAQTSGEDLQQSLATYLNAAGERTAVGALMFSCTGRGRYLYGRPDHDTDVFRDVVGGLPLGGFFCNGEIGPVAGTTYLHGYTSSFALFRPRTAPD